MSCFITFKKHNIKPKYATKQTSNHEDNLTKSPCNQDIRKMLHNLYKFLYAIKQLKIIHLTHFITQIITFMLYNFHILLITQFSPFSRRNCLVFTLAFLVQNKVFIDVAQTHVSSSSHYIPIYVTWFNIPTSS